MEWNRESLWVRHKGRSRRTLYDRKIQIVENFWSPWKMVISEPKCAHLREVLLFAFNWKKSATKAHRMIEEVHGDHALSKSQCYRWFKKFQSGDFELDNEPRGKPHQKFEDAELQALLDDDSTQTQEKLVKQLQVPHELSERQQERRLVTCEGLLARHEKKSFLHQIVTSDEKSIHFSNPMRQKSWGLLGQIPKRKPRPNRFRKKGNALSKTGVVYFKLLKPSETVNTSRYEQQMHSLREALNEKRPELREKHNKLILQHDNAPAHNATVGISLPELYWSWNISLTVVVAVLSSSLLMIHHRKKGSIDGASILQAAQNPTTASKSVRCMSSGQTVHTSSVGPALQAANINIGYVEAPNFKPEEEDYIEEFKTWLATSKVPKGDWTKALVRRLPLNGREFIRFEPTAALEDILEELKLRYPASPPCDETKAGIHLPNIEVFQGVGVINSECKMYTKPEYPPVRALPRRIPASLGNEVQSELEKMVKQGIITKIYHETEWSHPMVVVKKKSGQIRICLDPRKLNQALVRRHFQTPAPSELLHQIPKADYYTVLDVKSAYWHVPVANECRDLLVMATPFGKFRYNRLPFGLNISAQIFVEMMTNIFKNSFRNVTYVDDLLIYADSIEEHNEKLKGILEIARRNNIKFDLTKAQICKKEVSFLGHMISKNGIDPEPNKVDKVINLKKPEDKKSLQRVMGLYNYLGKFIPNLAASTSNIRGILKKNVVWHWGPRQDIEFHHIKECVRNAPSLGHYDKTKTLVLQCDASKDAMGAALLQENRPLAFASASFNDSQKQYSQIEKELLSIYYGCKKFEYLLLGHTFIIQTDHQPLLPLIQKPLTDISPRLQRIVMKLFAFDFKLQYRPGKCLILADTLSRDTHPIDELPTPFLEDRRMVKLISANISDEKLITLQKDTREDTTLLKIIHHVIEGWPISKKDVDEDVKPYYDFRHRIYLWNELLCVGSAIVVPGTQRNYMLELLHKSHQGISAIQGLARESLFWPGMSMDIAERVKSCDICQKYQKSKTRETLRSFPIPDYPWQTVSMDIFYIERKPHLLIVDRFSGYPEVYALNPPTATNVRNKLRETFARFGIPETIMSDNGPPFHSEIMTDFCTKWGIRQIFSSPHLHRSNGLAERNIQTIKTLLNKCKDQGSDAYLALLTYRNTPKNDLPSPAQLCLSRSLRCLIPRITPLYGPCKTNQRHIENAKKRRQISMKRYYDRSSKIYPKVSVGEEAWCQLSPKQAWTPVKITAHGNSPQSFKVETPSGREFLRNQQFLRPKNGPSGKGESPSLGTSFSGESSPVAADSSSWERTTEEEPVAGPSTTPIQQQQPRDGMAVPSENSSVMPRFSRFGRELKKPQRLGF
ncbi:K02A2.6-like [Cordylochernes scorpioides]|uniref:RNA-directed DNA polymerase n=1 Tax=Cordylochernes scorpioides TaxID=51811 RepID=A0ABY6K5N8_9ARAC|nr:K02A2.6-like [Cordylochernes scorpioides]